MLGSSLVWHSTPDFQHPQILSACGLLCCCHSVAGLLCLKPAKLGGKSSLASSVTIHNELLKRDPEIVRTLVRHAIPLAMLRHWGSRHPAGTAADTTGALEGMTAGIVCSSAVHMLPQAAQLAPAACYLPEDVSGQALPSQATGLADSVAVSAAALACPSVIARLALGIWTARMRSLLASSTTTCCPLCTTTRGT